MLENLKLQDEIQEIIVYDLGMTSEQINKLYSKYSDITYKKFKFEEYPAFFKKLMNMEKWEHMHGNLQLFGRY